MTLLIIANYVRLIFFFSFLTSYFLVSHFFPFWFEAMPGDGKLVTFEWLLCLFSSSPFEHCCLLLHYISHQHHYDDGVDIGNDAGGGGNGGGEGKQHFPRHCRYLHHLYHLCACKIDHVANHEYGLGILNPRETMLSLFD